jgi:hypothetical protein
MKKLLSLLFIIILFYGCGMDDKVLKQIPVVSIFAERGIHGSFFLGTGTIDTRDYYFYFIRMPDGGLKRIQIRSSMVVIYEGYDNPYMTWIGWKSVTPDRYVEACFDCLTWSSQVKLYLPRNTIIKKFEIR